MGLYQRHVLPRLIDVSMHSAMLAPYRRRAAAACTGRVLDVGVGSGHNLAFCSADCACVGLDVSPALLAKAAAKGARAGRQVLLVGGEAERMPLASGSFDAALLTWTLCSIADPAAALAEIRRILKAGGSLHYVEHGAAPEARVRRLQDRLTPAWRRISGGCHLNRDVPALLAEAGFRMLRREAAYAGGPRFLTYFYSGHAIAAER